MQEWVNPEQPQIWDGASVTARIDPVTLCQKPILTAMTHTRCRIRIYAPAVTG